MSACHPQVRQYKQGHQLRSVLRQSTDVRLYITKLALDYPELMLDLGVNLRFGCLDLVQRAALIQFLVSTAVDGNLLDDLRAFMFRTCLDVGVTRVGADYVFLDMQFFVNLDNVCNVGCCTDHAVNQTRFVIDANVSLHSEVILVCLLGLMYLRIAFAVLFLGRVWRIDLRCIEDGSLAQRDRPRSPR